MHTHTHQQGIWKRALAQTRKNLRKVSTSKICFLLFFLLFLHLFYYYIFSSTSSLHLPPPRQGKLCRNFIPSVLRSGLVTSLSLSSMSWHIIESNTIQYKTIWAWKTWIVRASSGVLTNNVCTRPQFSLFTQGHCRILHFTVGLQINSQELWTCERQ